MMDWGAVFTGFVSNVSVLVAVVGSAWWIRKKTVAETEKIKLETEQIRHQVKNTHPTNLRDDIDEVCQKVDTVAGSYEQLVARLNIQAIAFDVLSHKMQQRDDHILAQMNNLQTTVQTYHNELLAYKDELGDTNA